MNTKQAAELLGVSTIWVAHFLRKGRIKATKVDGEWVIDERDLRWFKSVPRQRGRRSKLPRETD